MSQDTAANREKKRRSKSADAIAALDASEGSSKPAAPAPAPKPKPRENVGTGRDDSQANFDRLSAGLRAKIAVAKKAGNTTLAVKLEARLAELRKTVQ